MDNSRRGTIFLLIAGGVLVIAAAVLILIPRETVQTEVPPLVESGPAEADIPFPQVPRISIADTKAHFDADSAIIVDVRRAVDYAASHIPNSLSIPEEELQARASELPMDAEILLYCTWPSEESSARAAHILIQLGYSNVKAIQGGYQAWIDAGHPVEES